MHSDHMTVIFKLKHTLIFSTVLGKKSVQTMKNKGEEQLLIFPTYYYRTAFYKHLSVFLQPDVLITYILQNHGEKSIFYPF